MNCISTSVRVWRDGQDTVNVLCCSVSSNKSSEYYYGFMYNRVNLTDGRKLVHERLIYLPYPNHLSCGASSFGGVYNPVTGCSDVFVSFKYHYQVSYGIGNHFYRFCPREDGDVTIMDSTIPATCSFNTTSPLSPLSAPPTNRLDYCISCG